MSGAPSADTGIADCPVVISVNIDTESLDAAAAGEAGLLGRYSYGRYGAREGLWRLLRVFRDLDVPATMFIEPGDAERHPELIEAIAGEGHELAVLGEAIETSAPRGPATRAELEKARDAFARLTGSPPAGWRSANGLLSPDALMALAELGYRYDSSFQDDDQPYLLDLGGSIFGELPVFDYLTDATFYAPRHTPDRARKAWLEEIEGLHSAGGYVHLTLHARGDIGSARALRAYVVSEILMHVAARPGVAFYRAGELVARMVDSGLPTEQLPAWDYSRT